MHPDEIRDPDAVRDLVAQRFVADPVRLREKYLGLAARDRRARRRIADLEAELATLRKAARTAQADATDLRARLGRAHGSLDAYRAENRRLKEDLRRVRTSTTMKVGRALLAPATAARRAVSSVRSTAAGASGSTVAPASAAPGVAPSTTSAPGTGPSGRTAVGASSTAPAPRSPAAAAPAARPGAAAPRPGATPAVRPSAVPLDDLIERLDTDGRVDDLEAVLTRLWFREGAVRRATEVLAGHPEAAAAMSASGEALARRVASAARVLEHGWELPPRSRGAAYLPEPGRVMYCIHSTPVFDSNGYSIRTGGVAAGLRANGHDVVAVARSGYPWDGRGRTGLPPRRRTVVEHDGVAYVHHPGLGIADATLEQYLDEAADAYVREARLLRPEVIHAASDAHTALPALVAARRLGIPFVYEVRGLWEVTAASTRPGWSESERYALQVRLETLVATEADAVLAITEQVAGVLRDRGVDPARITLLPNAVDALTVLPLPRDDVYAQRHKVRPGVPTIGFAGSLVPYEGLDVLVEAAALLRQRGRDVQVVIAGSGSAEAALRAQVEELGLGDAVRLLGRVPHGEVGRLVSTFDIMPCPRPSLPVTELVSPLKPLEAFAAGKAVVLSDVAPHRDLAGPGQERALLAAAGDAGALADRIEELIVDEDRRRALGRAGRLWVRRERTWDAVCGAAAQVYRRARDVAEASAAGRPLAEITVGVVADEFTTRTLEGTVRVVPMQREGWRDQLDAQTLDLLLVESAWKGNGGQWHRGVGHYSDEEHADVRGLIAECRARSVPVVFWNKEDPVHTERFLPTAVLCDHVFTVDASLVPLYRQAGAGTVRSASGLPFFAQPLIHNPLPGRRPYEPTVAYAGTYYGERYPDRTRALGRLLAAGRDVGLAIYDRQLTETDSPYRFPEEYQPFVRGGLPYAEVLDTYKAHLAHLNVNSVTDSPTMFSRRVVEIAASGGVVISGAARGLDETLGGAVPASDDREELAAWIGLWASDPQARRREAWQQLRAVSRAHTATTALTILTRTAGVATAVSRPEVGIVAPTLTTDLVAAVLRQSVRAECVVVEATEPDAQLVERLAAAGVPVCRWADLLQDGADAPQWLGHLPEDAVRTYLEDLLLCTTFGAWTRLEPCEADDGGTGSELVRPYTGGAPGRAGLVRTEDVLRLGSLDDALTAEPGAGLGVVLPEPVMPVTEPVEDAAPPAGPRATVHEPTTLLVAGHDLKFIRPAFPVFEAAGVRLLTDEWQSHTAHDEEESRRLLAHADAVFCEWGLGNAVWYSANVTPAQNLLIRVHSQELFTPHLRRIDHDRVDTYVFVGELVRRAAITAHGVPASKTELVTNMVDVAGLVRPKTDGADTTIGFVGMVPRGKRLDLALDVLEAVRRVDPRYRLSVKGRRPEEFPWLSQRPGELEYYAEQFERIEAINASAPGAVVLSPHGTDMAEWYRTVGTVLSVSDFESFHLTVADGVASGARPALLWWPGADLVYPPAWSSATVDEVAQRVLHGDPATDPSDVSAMAVPTVARRLLELALRVHA